MDKQTLEYAVLQNAVDACARETGIKIDIMLGKKAGQKADAVLAIYQHGKIITLEAEVRNRITTADTLLPLVRARNEPEKFILVTPQVTARMADRLKAAGIQFMDEAGNVFLNQPPLYLFVKGTKNPEVTRPPAVGRAFKQTGLQLLFHLICNQGLLNKPFRTIAAQAGVAFGVVNWTIRELKELGFLEETGTRRNRQARLIRKETLLERWVTGYAEQLRPKLLHGIYQGPTGWWHNVVLDPETALWGGEVAAAKLTKHLKPQDVTLYVDKQKPNTILVAHRLRKDPLGDVTLLYRFWNLDVIPPNQDVVPPLLVYADLMATGEQRNLETARMIYEKYIVQLIREA